MMWWLKCSLMTILPLTVTVGLIEVGITPPSPDRIQELTSFLGAVTIPTGFRFEDTEVGGLSGITYNRQKDVYYAVSDSQGDRGDARFYTLKLHWSGDPFQLEGVEVIGVTRILDANGEAFPLYSLDPEGIAFTGETVWIASEGNIAAGYPPFIKEFSLESGRQLSELPIPKQLFSPDNPNIGVRNNLATESLTLTPDGKTLFTATENALIQDGPAATVKEGSPSRIIRYNLETGLVDGQFLYMTEAIAGSSLMSETLQLNGLVELLAVSERRSLAMERSFSLDRGFVIRLFEVSVKEATDIRSLDSLRNQLEGITPVSKTPVLIPPEIQAEVIWDNLEGMTFGPTLPDGRRSLIMVSDNNFHPLLHTRIVVFAIDREYSAKPYQQRVWEWIENFFGSGVDKTGN